MYEDEVQLKRRDNEERVTSERARILGLPYLDTRDFENSIPLVEGVLGVQEMQPHHPATKGWRRRTLPVYGN